MGEEQLVKFNNEDTVPTLFRQGYRFLMVGGLATAVHVVLFAIFIEGFLLSPLLANLVAKTFAFAVGFTGHLLWTFSAAGGHLRSGWRAIALKFLIASGVGLALNSAVVYSVVEVLGLPYTYAVVLMISVVPATVFALSKYWAFAKA